MHIYWLIGGIQRSSTETKCARPAPPPPPTPVATEAANPDVGPTDVPRPAALQIANTLKMLHMKFSAIVACA